MIQFFQNVEKKIKILSYINNYNMNNYLFHVYL